jgi:pimeloyl-ACP methyl ester carboxylesterase
MVALHGSFGREFPAAGHWIHDDDPEGCANAILRFLTGLALPSMGNL